MPSKAKNKMYKFKNSYLINSKIIGTKTKQSFNFSLKFVVPVNIDISKLKLEI